MGAPKYDSIRRRIQADQRDKQARLNPKPPPNYAEVNTGEHTCAACGFRARYRYLRCPECGAAQK
ncbi:MAG: hypothetical protein KJ053_02250 [Dehalococcoidia bacterium]|nr:MAG: hypothetical protein EDM74_13915 [Armatimonadota bacterium]MCL4230379.1 hypothetical protein [Dehalococcoidia bacterium]